MAENNYQTLKIATLTPVMLTAKAIDSRTCLKKIGCFQQQAKLIFFSIAAKEKVTFVERVTIISLSTFGLDIN